MVTEVHSPVETVWNVLMDASYIPKLYPDVLTCTVDPPGRNKVGQKFHITGKAGRRRLEIFAETKEIVKRKKVVTTQAPGGMFKSFESEIVLDPRADVTHVLTSFEYELSMGYLGKVFNMVLLERLVTDNLKAYSKNLKEICELMPLPTDE
jgi:hypothetical protein